MSTLCAGHQVLVGPCGPILGRSCSQGHVDGFGAYHFQPVAPDVAAWPIAPNHRGTRGWLKWCENGWRGEHLLGRDRPENGTDPPGFDREKGFLTLCSHKAVATITNASSIQHTQRAIALRSSFLWVERMIGGARSEEHTSELQSPCNLVCRLLLGKKKKNM